MSEFGDYLKKLRGKESIRESAKNMGLSHTYLSTLEKGFDPRTKKERKPSYEVLDKLASYYNVSIAELLHKAGYVSENELGTLVGIEYMMKFQNEDFEDLEPNRSKIDISAENVMSFYKLMEDKSFEEKQDLLVNSLHWKETLELGELNPEIEKKLYQRYPRLRTDDLNKKYAIEYILSDETEVSFDDSLLTNEEKKEILNFIDYLISKRQ